MSTFQLPPRVPLPAAGGSSAGAAKVAAKNALLMAEPNYSDVKLPFGTNEHRAVFAQIALILNALVEEGIKKADGPCANPELFSAYASARDEGLKSACHASFNMILAYLGTPNVSTDTSLYSEEARARAMDFVRSITKS